MGAELCDRRQGLLRLYLAQQGGFPANKISEIKTMIDPTTAEKK